MDKFAFIVHPISVEQYVSTLSIFDIRRRLPKLWLKRLLPKISPYSFLHLKNIKSIAGKTIEGYLIICPMVPDQMVGDSANLAHQRVIEACELAQNMGVKIVGLAGFTSIITNQGEDVKRKFKNIAVTSGNTYTSCLAIDAVLDAIKKVGRLNDNITISVIGATGDIGSICSKVLAESISNLILVGRNKKKLELLVSEIKGDLKMGGSVCFSTDIRESVKRSNIILSATSAVVNIINPADLAEGAIVCDVSYPTNIDMSIINERKDVFIFEGGVAKNLWFENFKKRQKKLINVFNFPETLHGCAAETILLCLDERFDSLFSLGRGKISAKDISEIRLIAEKHGMSHAPFFAGKKVYAQDDLALLSKRIGRDDG